MLIYIYVQGTVLVFSSDPPNLKRFSVLCVGFVQIYYSYDLKFGDGDGPNLCRVKK